MNEHKHGRDPLEKRDACVFLVFFRRMSLNGPSPASLKARTSTQIMRQGQ